MRFHFTASATAMSAMLTVLSVPSLADTSLASPVVLDDGTTATPYDRCGAGDECGSVKYSNGDELVVYSEGAAYGQPYRLHFTLLKGGSVPIVQYDVATATESPRFAKEADLLGTYTLARGTLRLDIYANKDGTLKPKFTKGVAKT